MRILSYNYINYCYMETTNQKNKETEALKNDLEAKKESAAQQEAATGKQLQQEEEEGENPFGGISSRNLKKNLGCGG